MNKVAIGIACWNRPQYFSQLLSSLEANLLDLENVDTHLFIDGDICAFTGEQKTDKKLIYENISLFQKALIPNKTMHVRSLNVSVAIHQFEMMKMLTSIYDKIIFLEDDVVLSPNFVAVMKQLLNQFENDEKIFSISSGFKLMCKPTETEQYKDAIKSSEGHFWAEAIWTKKWNKILPRLQQYMDIVYQKSYMQRDHGKIKTLFENGGRVMSATSQDNAKDWAISLSGMTRARLVVNRATGIGDVGVHSTHEKLKKFGDGHNKIYVFDDEKKMKFRVI